MPENVFFDFNSALSLYCASEEYESSCASIKEKNIEVARMMKDLKDPPKKYEDAYEIIEEMHGYYEDLISLVDPTGSLKDYSSAFSTADSKFMDLYHKLDLEFDIINE